MQRVASKETTLTHLGDLLAALESLAGVVLLGRKLVRRSMSGLQIEAEFLLRIHPASAQRAGRTWKAGWAAIELRETGLRLLLLLLLLLRCERHTDAPDGQQHVFGGLHEFLLAGELARRLRVGQLGGQLLLLVVERARQKHGRLLQRAHQAGRHQALLLLGRQVEPGVQVELLVGQIAHQLGEELHSLRPNGPRLRFPYYSQWIIDHS